MEKVKNVSVTGYEVELWDYISNCELSFGNIKKMSGKETVLKSVKCQNSFLHTYLFVFFFLAHCSFFKLHTNT